MKYLIVILVLVGVSTATVFYSFWTDPKVNPHDAALSVNGQAMSQKQMDDLIKSHGYHGEDRSERVDALVTRQLLIQEAQRLEIDKEEGFRQALKQYYEQSLIKVLTDRQIAQIKVTVSDKDIDKYLAGSGKKFTFTVIPVQNGKQMTAQGKQHTAAFDDLSESFRLILSALEPGESVSRFDTGTEISIIRLDKVEEAGGKTVDYDRGRIGAMLENYQRGREVDRWIHQLREKASIVVRDKEKIHD